MEENNRGYIGYQAMLSTISTGASQLSEICQEMGMGERAEDLKRIMARLRNHSFSVGIMGEFKRGKSTVINALLGKEVLPADIIPCSATLNQIKWDATARAEVQFKDGTVREVGIEELSNYVTKLTEESEQQAENVEQAIVYYPCRFCQNGVTIIDTPGLNDDDRMEKIAESVLPTLDAIIMVIVPDSPFSISEAEFVRNKVMTSDLGRIIFVVNKIDMVRPRDRERVLEAIKKKIQSSVLEKVGAIYGTDSKEYEESRSKLGGIRVYPLSARDALDGRLDGDDELVAGSGILEFEGALTQLLTEERGLLELAAPVNTLLGAAKEVRSLIVMRRNGLEEDKEKFAVAQAKAMEEIDGIRARKKEETERLRAESRNAYGELLPAVEGVYADLERRLLTFIEEYPMSEENVKNDSAMQATAATVSEKLDGEFQTCLAEHTERLQMMVLDRLGKQMEQVKLFNESVMADMGRIQCLIPDKGAIDKMDMAGVVVDTITSYSGILAIGGVISGWKANGISGALVGGGAGFVAGIAAMLGAVSLGVVGLPLALIGGVVSTFGGKAVTNLVFHGKIATRKIEELRESLRKGMRRSIEELRREKKLEGWLKTSTDAAFYNLSEQLDVETENMLRNTEITMGNIRADLERDKAERESIAADLEKKERSLSALCQGILPVKEKLSAVIAGV